MRAPVTVTKDAGFHEPGKKIGSSLPQAGSGGPRERPRSGAFTQQNPLLTGLEAASPRSRRQRGWFLLSPHFLACRWPPAHCVSTWLYTACTHPWWLPPLRKVPIGLEPCPLTAFKRHYLFKGAIPKNSHIGN